MWILGEVMMMGLKGEFLGAGFYVDTRPSFVWAMRVSRCQEV